jgi:hypothetical protein
VFRKLFPFARSIWQSLGLALPIEEGCSPGAGAQGAYEKDKQGLRANGYVGLPAKSLRNRADL